MSQLLIYLNKNFAGQMFEEGAVEYLQIHFMEKFGVVVKHEGPFFLFKYDMIAAKYQYALTHECRGCILHVNPVKGVWRYVSRPFDKFFNQGEGYCPIFDEKEFNKALPDLAYMEKVDGSCIQLWWDDTAERWRVSTLGMITTGNVQDTPIKFDELFCRVFGTHFLKLNTLFTYIFELCATENRVLSKFSSDRIYLLSARETQTGIYMTWPELDSLVGLWNTPAIRRPDNGMLQKDRLIDSLGSALVWVEDEATVKNPDLEYPEGYVLYLNGRPICKLKNRTYVQASRVVGGDHKHTRNLVIEAVVLGTLDDIWKFLADPMKVFAEEIKQKYLAEMMKVQNAFTILGGTEYATQKDFALAVQREVPKVFQGFFFQNKKIIFSDSTQIPPLFEIWMRQHYEKFVKSWKGLA